MTFRALTDSLPLEGPADGTLAQLPMSSWAGLSAVLCGLLSESRSATSGIWIRLVRTVNCSSESRRLEHAESQGDNSVAEIVGVEDWADVRASLDGDGQAYARLVDRYQGRISAYLWRFTRNRTELEELVQDVFVEAYVGLAKFAGKAPLLHWLKRIATRVGYRFWKDRGRRDRDLVLMLDADSIAAIANDTTDARQIAEVVHVLLAALKPRDRLVLTLAYLEDFSVKEIARLTGWSEVMVKVQLHRARQRFAKRCELNGVEP